MTNYIEKESKSVQTKEKMSFRGIFTLPILTDIKNIIIHTIKVIVNLIYLFIKNLSYMRNILTLFL